MTRSSTEIAAEAFGDGWPEMSDKVRGEWESFVDEVRAGNVALRKDERYAGVLQVLGLSMGDSDVYAPSGEDAVITDTAPKKKPSVIAKLKGSKKL